MVIINMHERLQYIFQNLFNSDAKISVRAALIFLFCCLGFKTQLSLTLSSIPVLLTECSTSGS